MGIFSPTKKEEIKPKTITIPETGIGDVSDGYHTFNELYDHRAKLFSVICNQNSELAWKSLKHHDGTMYDNMFIVGIETPEGQATYHYDINPYWDYFNVKELESAPEWDGHTPTVAVDRLLNFGKAISTSEVITKEKLIEVFAKDLADKQKLSDYFFYIQKDQNMSSFILDGIHNMRNLYGTLGIAKEIYEEAYKIYDFHNSGKDGFVPDLEDLKKFVFK